MSEKKSSQNPFFFRDIPEGPRHRFDWERVVKVILTIIVIIVLARVVFSLLPYSPFCGRVLL